MARGIRKYIIKDVKTALSELRKIGPENVTGVSGVRTAFNPATGDTTEYHTIYHHTRAEIEISVPVMDFFVSRGIFVLEE